MIINQVSLTVLDKRFIDITLVNYGIYNNIIDWEVLQDNSFSDHRYIQYTFAERVDQVSKGLNVRKMNIARYVEVLDADLGELNDWNFCSAEDVDIAVRQLNSCVLHGMESSCPPKGHATSGMPPWWNARIAQFEKSNQETVPTSL
ncbi:MAG: hypothetical protein ACRY3E_02200 [Candidatus Lariskella arthropodorum]